MIALETALAEEISRAFNLRSCPPAQIILPQFDLLRHMEAFRIDVYMQNYPFSIDRSSCVLSAFAYLTDAAAKWAIPHYMISILKDFKEDDYIIDVICSVLAGNAPYAPYESRSVLRLRALMNDQEAETVCRFCRWLLSKAKDLANEEQSGRLLKVWCAAGLAR